MTSMVNIDRRQQSDITTTNDKSV